MNLFEKIKNIPKVDLHINLTSLITPALATKLNLGNIQELEFKMVEKDYMHYNESIKISLEILKNEKKYDLIIQDIIESLNKNNIKYAEIYYDLTLYEDNNETIEKLLTKLLKIIKDYNIKINIILVLSSEFNKEKNIFLLDLLDKYYNKGINGIYFQKNKMDNISNYAYIFDRLIKNNIPYILEINQKLTYQDEFIYLKAKRLISMLNEIDNQLIDKIKENNIILELAISQMLETKVIQNIENSYIKELLNNNINITFVTYNMTQLDTNIINEYCILFNKLNLEIIDIIKIINNNINNININEDLKEEIINNYKKIELEVIGE